MVETKKGLVLFCDALGIRDLSVEQCQAYLQNKDKFINKAKSLWPEMLKQLEIPKDNVSPEHGLRIFGDSFIFFWTYNEITSNNLTFVSAFIATIIKSGLESGFYLRGALSYGDFLIDEDVIIGPALFDAYNWHDKTNWFGVIATPSLGIHLSKISHLNPIIDKKTFCDFMLRFWIKYNDTPLKNLHGNVNNYWVIDWPILFYFANITLQKDERTRKSYGDFYDALLNYNRAITYSNEDKIFNSIKFFKKSLDNIDGIIASR